MIILSGGCGGDGFTFLDRALTKDRETITTTSPAPGKVPAPLLGLKNVVQT